MRHPAATAKLLAICGAVGLGCGSAMPDYVVGRPAGEPLDLLVRAFLVDGKETEGYGYYAYLVFTENSEATRAQREAAVHAFINLLTDVRRVAERDKPARLAVLYVPVTKDWRGPDAKAEGVFEAYDYLFAQRLAVQLARHRSIPPVFLLGSPVPVHKALSAGKSDLWVVELKGDRQAIESTITGFRDRLLNPDRPFSGKEMLERVLGFFDSVGGFVIAIATLGGGTSSSKP